MNEQKDLAGCIPLDSSLEHPLAKNFRVILTKRVVGQERVVKYLSKIYQNTIAKLSRPAKPIAALLFLGPTGSGKTYVASVASDILYGHQRAVKRIDCAEFQQDHEISKLIGSPPGYLGHKDTNPIFSAESLTEFPITFLIFDEIEKASPALWRLLLGILDKAEAKTGQNKLLDFRQCIIILTSNLGSKEMGNLTEVSIGFNPKSLTKYGESTLDQKIYKTALDAAKRNFSPEFMNRLDKTIVFRSLTQAHIEKIFMLEFIKIQERILRSSPVLFGIAATPELKEFVIQEGWNQKYGARFLERAMERFIVDELSRYIATAQIKFADTVWVHYLPQQDPPIQFFRKAKGSLDICKPINDERREIVRQMQEYQKANEERKRLAAIKSKLAREKAAEQKAAKKRLRPRKPGSGR